MAATAEGWLRRFERNPQFDLNVEPELETALVEDGRRVRFLDHLIPNGVAVGARFFAQLGRLTERQFLEWFDRIISRVGNGELLEPDGMALGQAIDARKWWSAAGRVARQAVYRHDLRPTLMACYELVGWVERSALYMAGVTYVPPPSEDDLWHLLEQTAVNLYPTGPEHDEIWSRAGGLLSKLPQAGNGQARWHGALRELRKGGAGILPGRLVAEMRRDFGGNYRVLWLASRPPFDIDY